MKFKLKAFAVVCVILVIAYVIFGVGRSDTGLQPLDGQGEVQVQQ